MIYIIGDKDFFVLLVEDGNFWEAYRIWSWTRGVGKLHWHLEFFFTANDIKDAEMKKAILLSSSGSKTYKLFRGLTAPAKPGDKTLLNWWNWRKTIWAQSLILLLSIFVSILVINSLKSQ